MSRHLKPAGTLNIGDLVGHARYIKHQNKQAAALSPMIQLTATNRDCSWDHRPIATVTRFASPTGNDCPKCCTIKAKGAGLSNPSDHHADYEQELYRQTKRVHL